MKKSTKNKVQFLAYASPWMIGFLCFGIFPLGYSLYMSFCSYQMVGEPIFVGLDNFKDLFTQERFFWKTFENTFTYMGVVTVLGMFLGLLFSLAINSIPKCKRLFQSLYYLPSILPFISSSMLWIAMFAKTGILNTILNSLGLNIVSWLNNDNAMKSIVLMAVWGGIGGKITMFLPAVAGVPKELLESMDLDGASWWTKFVHITLPMISPTIFYLLIMDIINGLQVYGPMMMLGGGTATLTVTLQIYNYAMVDRMMGYASAYAWIVFAIIMVVTFIFFKFGGKKVYYVDGD